MTAARRWHRCLRWSSSPRLALVPIAVLAILARRSGAFSNAFSGPAHRAPPSARLSGQHATIPPPSAKITESWSSSQMTLMASLGVVGVAAAASSRNTLVGNALQQRRQSKTSVGATKVPDIGETTIFVGVDYDIPRQRAFNFGLWDAHRKNPDRYVKLMDGIFSGSTIMQRLKYPLMFLGLVSVIVVVYNEYLQPEGFPLLKLPITPFNLSSPALGLLLVFRVTGSSNRYTEARMMWGDIVNTTRDLLQMSMNWGTMAEFSIFASYVSLFPAALMCQLRRPEDHDLKEELEKALGSKPCLSQQDMMTCVKRPPGVSPAMFVLHRMRAQVKMMQIGTQERMCMETAITRLVVDVGACERILSTPVPVGFTIHTARFLLLWLALLPLALESGLGPGTVIGEVVLGFGLLGIEDNGIMLEEPFCVMPVEAMCNKIAREARGLIAANKQEMIVASKESTSMKFEVPKVVESIGGRTVPSGKATAAKLAAAAQAAREKTQADMMQTVMRRESLAREAAKSTKPAGKP